MTKTKSNPKQEPTGNAVPPKATEKESASQDNRIQIHQGNIPVVTCQLLSDINQKLGRIAAVMEKSNGR